MLGSFATGVEHRAAREIGATISGFGNAGPPAEIRSISMSIFAADPSYFGQGEG